MSRSQSKSGARTDKGRRSFIWKAGAAVTAVLATAAPALSMSKSGKDKGLEGKVNSLTGKLESLEEEKKIRQLHQTFEALLDSGRYEDTVELFATDAEIKYNGGIFRGKEKGVKRLMCENFGTGKTGKKIASAPGFEVKEELLKDNVVVSADRKTAKASFSYSIQVGAPIISDSVLISMARLQGDGVMKWWEGGVYNVSYIKDAKAGTWKIKNLEYQTLSKADYKPGRSYAKSIDLPLFSKVYPEDPAGPDKLCG